MKRLLLGPCLFLIALVLWQCCLAPSASAQSVKMAIAQAQRTGRPIFAVAGATSCPHCVRLIQQLNTEERLQPLIEQFIPLKLDVTTTEFARWEKFFPRYIPGIPALYVVTPQGQALYNRTGALPTEGLEEMLLDILRTAGRYPTDEEWTELAKLFEESKKTLEDEQPVAALEVLEPHLEALMTLGPLIDYHKEGKEMVEHLKQLETAGKELLATASQISAGQATFVEAMLLTRAERLFGMFPSLEDDVRAAVKGFSSGTNERRLMREARELDQAILMLNDEKLAKRAERTLQRIAKSNPDSPAAEIAAAALAEAGSE